MEFAKGPTNSCEETLSRMVTQYEVMLLRTCYMYLHDRQLAQDATQETFLKAYRSLSSFRGESSEKTWLMKIAVNTCRDMKRSAWFRMVDHSAQIDRLPAPARVFEHMEADDLTQAILHLPSRHKEVILLYYYQDMTMREVAAALGISLSCVDKRLKSACKKLKAKLGKEDFYES